MKKNAECRMGRTGVAAGMRALVASHALRWSVSDISFARALGRTGRRRPLPEAFTCWCMVNTNFNRFQPV